MLVDVFHEQHAALDARPVRRAQQRGRAWRGCRPRAGLDVEAVEAASVRKPTASSSPLIASAKQSRVTSSTTSEPKSWRGHRPAQVMPLPCAPAGPVAAPWTSLCRPSACPARCWRQPASSRCDRAAASGRSRRGWTWRSPARLCHAVDGRGASRRRRRSAAGAPVRLRRSAPRSRVRRAAVAARRSGWGLGDHARGRNRVRVNSRMAGGGRSSSIASPAEWCRVASAGVRCGAGGTARAARRRTRSSRPHSCASTPPAMPVWWLSWPLANRSTTEPAAPVLGSKRAEHHALEARVHQRHRAHRAGLQRHVELTLAAGSWPAAWPHGAARRSRHAPSDHAR